MIKYNKQRVVCYDSERDECNDFCPSSDDSSLSFTLKENLKDKNR